MRQHRGDTIRPFDVEALTPVSFLTRSAVVHTEKLAVIDGERRWTYGEFDDRCARLAGALAVSGVKSGQRVAVLAPNTATALAATFAVPRAGGVLVALNTRLSTAELSYILEHAEVSVLLVDHEFEDRGRAAIEQLERAPELVVDDGAGVFDELLEAAAPLRHGPANELDLLAINYTSGTTGKPKGVMYSHRGAYLQSLAMLAHSQMTAESVFLWTLPIFHCNGWCFPWAVTAAGGAHVCLRKVAPKPIWDSIRCDGVTHFNAAPTVLADIAASEEVAQAPAPRRVRVATGGAPPSPALLESLTSLNFEITHLYGLTETYGPAVICDWKPEWDDLDDRQRARRHARQGVSNLVGVPLRVVNGGGRDVARDGTSQGEVLLRGNNVMVGYYRDPKATMQASRAGWFRTGDIGVIHPDGYLELRDRAKDVIISGGENIASIEVEHTLATHPAVLECAVVGAPHERWGEVPVAFVALREGAEVSEAELIAHCKQEIARFKAPQRVVFGRLPKTGTGKVKKFVLRDAARA